MTTGPVTVPFIMALGLGLTSVRSDKGAEDDSRFFHITIQPEKEVVFTIVPLSIKKAVMQSIFSRILEKSGEHGIVFSIPVDEALGLRMPDLPNSPNA